ncbi:dihydroorotate oxidase A [Psychroflexus salarius]|uniref:Dihydroorotate dehydrogenase (quinone) n=1 Tax=Psychroflexus salarius TaxID=1155689 RepID=A0A1M4X8J9_9FLAO|nr:quinone-dependent dihydroorotate dehydrogenase [Psychroflexus salarius]SHE89725.1 dihydroorotate oxidase A [Psychroflexus salarius]
MYNSLIKPLLFQFDPEKIHYFSFKSIKLLHKIPFVDQLIRKQFCIHSKSLEREVFGIKFPNPVGLAAGFDKDAKLINELNNFGFGFIEIGTLTPKPQAGNPKKRLFRLIEDEAIINRMGFNNEGVMAAVKRLKSKGEIIIGGNIGKNKVTPNAEAINDYAYAFEALFEVVDYFVVNVSSPNTPNLRELQDKRPLTNLLSHLKELNAKKSNPKPILLKIAPDLNTAQLIDIIDIVEQTEIDGLIATNTTISRDGLQSKHKAEAGGLSGKPLTKRSTEAIKFIKEHQTARFPVIAVGGIMTAQDALEKLEAGADLIQLYTGFVFHGPKLIKSINKAILKRNK